MEDAARANAEAEAGDGQQQPGQDGQWQTSQELSVVLASRRQRLEESAQTFESRPKGSTADASQVQGLSFDAPDLQTWLSKFRTEEEDRTAELLAISLRERGPVPAHAPRAADGHEAEHLKNLASSLTKLQQEVAAERARLCDKREEIAAREAQLKEALEKFEKEDEEQRRLEKARRDYPPPQWLVKSEGTINVGVVGNSGVGKSLLINRLRGMHPGMEGWAPVGVSETTMAVSMYAFPNERRARLWDCPGVGTQLFPRETYTARMGLRYLDSVLVVTAGRFTENEIALQTELDEHKVPYFMVRTKADIDVWNNREDNGVATADTLRIIFEDLCRQCHHRPYIVSLRDPTWHDFPQLLKDAFPGLSRAQLATSLGGGWDDPWVMPAVLSPLVAGIQGRWASKGLYIYYVSGLEVHVTEVHTGKMALARLIDSGDKLHMQGGWFLDAVAVRRAGVTGKLCWWNHNCKEDVVWRWMD